MPGLSQPLTLLFPSTVEELRDLGLTEEEIATYKQDLETGAKAFSEEPQSLVPESLQSKFREMALITFQGQRISDIPIKEDDRREENAWRKTMTLMLPRTAKEKLRSS